MSHLEARIHEAEDLFCKLAAARRDMITYRLKGKVGQFLTRTLGMYDLYGSYPSADKRGLLEDERKPVIDRIKDMPGLLTRRNPLMKAAVSHPYFSEKTSQIAAPALMQDDIRILLQAHDPSMAIDGPVYTQIAVSDYTPVGVASPGIGMRGLIRGFEDVKPQCGLRVRFFSEQQVQNLRPEGEVDGDAFFTLHFPGTNDVEVDELNGVFVLELAKQLVEPEPIEIATA